jgi:hypothetical protein
MFSLINKHKLSKSADIIILTSVFTLVFFIIVVITNAATYTWVQTDWSTGTSASNASHDTDQTGWNKFASSTNVTFSTSGEIYNVSGGTTETNDTDFGGGTNSDTFVSGTGSSASVKLTVTPTTGTIPNWNFATDMSSWTCTSGTCTWESGTISGGDEGRVYLSNYGVIKSSNFYLPATSDRLTWATLYGVTTKIYRASDDALLVTCSWPSSNGSQTCSGLSPYVGTEVYLLVSDTDPTYDPKEDYFQIRNSSNVVLNVEFYTSSGTFTSQVIDTGYTSSFSTLSYTATTPTNTAVTFDVRAGDVATPDGTWTSWQTSISNGGDISALDGNRYVQYRANLSRNGTASAPTVDSVTINHYVTTGELTSSAFDTTDSTNVLSSIAWTESFPSGGDIKFQLRTAPDSSGVPGTWGDWVGSSGATTTYFTDPAGGESMPSALSDGSGDQWLQYKAYFVASSGTVGTSTLSDVTMTYVVNASPNFDSSLGSNGITVSQISDSADANWGKVEIQYSIRDTDTSTGTTNPGYITPSFEYNTGSGWNTITSSYLPASALSNKTVNSSTYTTYTTYWDAQSQISSVYSTATQVRVTINDNEGANNTSSATDSSITIDTTVPTITSATIDSSLDNINLNTSDDTNIEYRISNNSDYSADGSNASSGLWQSVGSTSTSTTVAWTLTGAPSFESVYFQVRDIYGNTTSSSIVAPSTPSNVEIKDISNTQTDSYKLFVNWNIYSATTSAAFQNYKLYNSTDGSSFSLLSTITDVNLNYYLDSSVASTTTYYYKVATTDTDSDISSYSSTVSDLPNGQGGTDNTAPTISSVVVTATEATWANITWTTDEVSNSTVEFSTASAGDYSSNTSNTSFVTSHDITINGLSPGTDYALRVKSTDSSSNSATDDNSGSGYTFTTAAGPVISNVTTGSVNDSSATVTWNTDKDSNSYVIYSSSLSDVQSDTNTTTVGSGSLVGSSSSVYQHNVSLTGLTAKQTYYYYVKSIDGSSNTVTDNNGGSYYSFTTTYDTRAPVISSIAVPVKTASQLVVLWQTDELSDSQVEYGTVSGSYPSSTTLDSVQSITHSSTIASLSESTAYYFRVKSADAQGNSTTSIEQSATTTSAKATVYVGGGSVAPSDSVPPVISNIKIKDISAFSAVVSFDTDEDTIALILYSKDLSYKKTAAADSYSKKHSVTIYGLKLGTKYNLKIKAYDKSGNSKTSESVTFKTKFASEVTEDTIKLDNVEQYQDKLGDLIESMLPSVSPPLMKNFLISGIASDSATITWDTNIPSYSTVSYASDNYYDGESEEPYATEISQTELKRKEHNFKITRLSPGEVYHIQTKSFVFPQIVSKSKDITFLTKLPKIRPELTKVQNTEIEVRWVTGIKTTSFVEYTNIKTGSTGRVGNKGKKVKNHSVLLENLIPATRYKLRVFGYDKYDNLVESEPMTTITKKDMKSPNIFSLKINNAFLSGKNNRLQTVISWKTDELSNSLVYSKEGVSGIENFSRDALVSGNKNEFTTEHNVVLTTLKPLTAYLVQVVSVDESGNKTKTPIRTLLTPQSTESVSDIIFRNFNESFGFLNKLKK